MKKEALSQFGHPELIMIALLLFLFSFLGISIITYLKSKKEIVYQSYLPLDNKENVDESR